MKPHQEIISSAFEQLDVDWTPGRERTVAAGVQQRIERRPRQVAMVTALAVATLLVAGWSAWRTVFGEQPQVAAVEQEAATSPKAVAKAPPSSGEALRLSDGSHVTFTKSSALTVNEDSAKRQSLTLRKGSARFNVVPREDRPFTVSLPAEMSVHVIGTEFTLEAQSQRARVLVHHGKVRVDWPEGSMLLTDGEEAWFPPMAMADEMAEDDDGQSQQAVRSPQNWRSLHSHGQFKAAYEELHRRGSMQSISRPDDLFAAADVARRSGHASEAVAPLERLLREFPNHRTASQAAFILGKVYLQLGNPSVAAARFARARQLGGGIAEEALAREVQAWAKAGNHPMAVTRAKEYLKLYPNGLHAPEVRRHAQTQ